MLNLLIDLAEDWLARVGNSIFSNLSSIFSSPISFAKVLELYLGLVHTPLTAVKFVLSFSASAPTLTKYGVFKVVQCAAVRTTCGPIKVPVHINSASL